MPIPPGVEPQYIWCLLWLAVEAALLGVCAQLGSLEEIRERVVARTYRRLPPLNGYLNRAYDEHWRSGELVPDHHALIALKREVDRAAHVDTLLRRRIQLLAGCRLLAVVEVAGVYAFRRGRDVCFAVECKETNWRGALRQAVAYQVAADLVFLAMPAPHVTDNVTREMRQRLSLIHISE